MTRKPSEDMPASASECIGEFVRLLQASSRSHSVLMMTLERYST